MLITCTYHSNNPCFQNAEQLKPGQRHGFYNNLVETLLRCAKIIALQSSIHFRISCLCDCSQDSTPVQTQFTSKCAFSHQSGSVMPCGELDC